MREEKLSYFVLSTDLHLLQPISDFLGVGIFNYVTFTFMNKKHTYHVILSKIDVAFHSQTDYFLFVEII